MGGFRYSMEHWLYRMLALAAEIWQLQLLLEGPGMFVVSMVAVCCNLLLDIYIYVYISEYIYIYDSIFKLWNWLICVYIYICMDVFSIQCLLIGMLVELLPVSFFFFVYAAGLIRSNEAMVVTDPEIADFVLLPHCATSARNSELPIWNDMFLFKEYPPGN